MNNVDPVRYANHYIGLLRKPGTAEDALHRLIEAGSELVPILMDLVKNEGDPNVRAKILHVLWQGRDIRVVQVLADALRDRESSVWREALDGLSSFPREIAQPHLEAALSEFTQKNELTKVSWVQEALADAEG